MRVSFRFMRQLVSRFAKVPTSTECLVPGIVGLVSGSLGGTLHFFDTTLGKNFLTTLVPDDVVFNVFVVFGSLVAGFRTAHALSRYTDAACYLHKINACWFDSASMLLAFCRNSKAPQSNITQFEHTLVRLVSILSALCLDGLQQKEPEDDGHRFEVLGAEDIDVDTQAQISESDHKVECVFQMIQQVVVDAIDTQVLSIAPPILSRSFQELGAGLLTYHEAKKLACVPFPPHYLFFTVFILICEALFVPWMMAVYTRGAFSAFFYTFCGVFLLWFLNSVATALDNPFTKEARTLEASKVQRELNRHLEQCLAQARRPSPVCQTQEGELSTNSIPRSALPKRGSFGQWQVMAAHCSSDRSLDDVPFPRHRNLEATWQIENQSTSSQGDVNMAGHSTGHPTAAADGEDSADMRHPQGEWQPGKWQPVGSAAPGVGQIGRAGQGSDASASVGTIDGATLASPAHHAALASPANKLMPVYGSGGIDEGGRGAGIGVAQSPPPAVQGLPPGLAKQRLQQAEGGRRQSACG